MTSEVKWQNYLNDATEALLVDDSVDNIREHYGIPYGEGDDLIGLIESINSVMTEVQPSKQFSRHLKDELMGVEHTGVVWRIRRMPARVQMAALAAILSGFLLILQRIFLADTTSSESSSAFQEES
jgi:hypothetical protein